MAADIQTLRPYLQDCDLTGLMVEGLGWNQLQSAPVSIAAGNETYQLQPVAEKAGCAVYRCSPNPDGGIPPQSIRRQIERKAAESNYERLIIFVDAAETRQVWQWVKRESGKRPALRELRYDQTQTGTALLHRVLDEHYGFTDEELDFIINYDIKYHMEREFGSRRSAMDILTDTPGRRLFKTAAELDEYIQAERESWEG